MFKTYEVLFDSVILYEDSKNIILKINSNYLYDAWAVIIEHYKNRYPIARIIYKLSQMTYDTAYYQKYSIDQCYRNKYCAEMTMAHVKCAMRIVDKETPII